MSWMDDPANLYNGYDQIVDPKTFNGWWYAGGQFWYIGGQTATATTPPPAPAPAPTPPHLQFSSQTIGSTTFLAMGQCRLPGQLIWAEGVFASSDQLDTSTLSFAVAFCEPIDPAESVYLYRMWANGTLFYQNGVVTVDNIDANTQAQLNACISSMAFYTGAETQLPDSYIENAVAQDLGPKMAPAFRGLRYIRFVDFPLLVAGNTVPNISAEFRLNSGGLIAVSDVITKLATKYGISVSVSGVANYCNGIVITSQQTFAQHIQDAKAMFSYQIVDGSPIQIIRRPVDNSLVINLSVNEQDLVRQGTNAALITTRVDPSSLPIGIDVQYTDPDFDYDTKTQQGRHDGSSPSSSTVASLSTPYIMDASTARSLAYDVLYQQRAQSLRINFELNDMRPQVSDTISITTDTGDTYVCLVDTQTSTKARSNQIQSRALLTSGGFNVDGIGGYNFSKSAFYWPETFCNGLSFDVDGAADRLWAFGEADGFHEVFAVNYASAPLRKLSRSKWVDMFQVSSYDPVTGNPIYTYGDGWGGQGKYDYFAGYAGMTHDDNYFYFIQDANLVISRVPKTSITVADIETITIPAGFFVDGSFNNDNINVNQCGVFAQVKDGKLYVPWYGRFNGVGSGNSPDVLRLIVIDLAAWSPSAYTAYTVATGSNLYYPTYLAVTDDNMVVIGTIPTATGAGTYFYANLANLNSWSSQASTLRFSEWVGARSGSYVFFGTQVTSGVGVTTKIAVINTGSGGFSETIVDLHTQDSNVISLSRFPATGLMWCSDTHLFVMCNHSRGYNSLSETTQPEHRYVGRFTADTVCTAAGGKFVKDIWYNEFDQEWQVGKYDPASGKNYMMLFSFSAGSSFLVIDEDLNPASAQMYNPTPALTVAPSNNSFANAIPIELGKTYNGNLTYANTEAGEPVPDYIYKQVSPEWSESYENIRYNNGHSVWYEFYAPTTGSPSSTNYTITVTAAAGFWYQGIQVYTGSSLATLTPVAGQSQYNYVGTPGTLQFDAVAGTLYKIAITEFGVTDVFGGAIIYTNFGIPSGYPYPGGQFKLSIKAT